MPGDQQNFREQARAFFSEYFTDVDLRSKHFRETAFEYEKFAIDYSHKGFQSLTYLNGGALLAIPTAMAFFKAEVGRGIIIATGGCFIFGLLLVVGALMAAYFTVSARGEAYQAWQIEQTKRVDALSHPLGSELSASIEREADNFAKLGHKKEVLSNSRRIWGIVLFGASVASFIVGCIVGGIAIYTAAKMS